MKMEPRVSSEKSAIRTQTPGNYPKRNNLHLEHDESLRTRLILSNVRQHNQFITEGNYKATCFDYRLVIHRPILFIVSQYGMHNLGSHRVYIYGIQQNKSFVSKGVTCKLCLHQWDS